jgi:hypothetical protein
MHFGPSTIGRIIDIYVVTIYFVAWLQSVTEPSLPMMSLSTIPRRPPSNAIGAEQKAAQMTCDRAIFERRCGPWPPGRYHDEPGFG